MAPEPPASRHGSEGHGRPARLIARGPSFRRRAADVGAVTGCHLAAAIVILPLGLIVWHLVKLGAAGISPAFFTHLPAPVGEPGGGMANAIIGTAVLAGLATLIAVPIGVGTGLY